MSNPLLDNLKAIARELPAVGKRSELKVKADEILRLTEMVRLQATEMRREIRDLLHEYPAQRFRKVKGVNLE